LPSRHVRLYQVRVSKKRPSSPDPTGERPPRDSVDYWRHRLYRNSYTHAGRRYQVAHWCVKIQVGRVRRTFSLKAATLEAAATEALTLYRELRGDPAAKRNAPTSAPTSGPADRHSAQLGGLPDRTLPAHWKPRLIHRKYVGRLPGRTDAEWSVLVEHRGERAYFPLGTDDENLAAAAAADRYQIVVAHGWKQARLNFFREVTVGVFWSSNPFACTYTTLLSIPATEPTEALRSLPPSVRSQQVFLIESDYGVRRALTYWLCRHQLAAVQVRGVERHELEAVIRTHPAALTLVNIDADADRVPLHQTLTKAFPDRHIFGYGVFEDSDHIFASLSGVTGGYILRRRSPESLLEPVLGGDARGRKESDPPALRARRYFEGLFGGMEKPATQPEAGLLTVREYEILSFLSKGYQDKEIADRLGISVWTVHSHLRKIFAKYGVHSRTEAVVKYLKL